MSEASVPVRNAAKLRFPAQALWKTALGVFRTTRLTDVRVGRFSMRGLHRFVVRHCVWPYYSRLAQGEVTFRHQKMYVPQDSDSLGFVMGTFEQQTCEFFERVLEEGMTVVDAGANIGFYSLLAARKVGPKGKVYAFEPEPANFALLKRNIDLNGYTNIVALPKAIAASNSQVALYLSPEGSGSHSLYHDSAVGSACVNVESVSFDDFWEAEGRPAIRFIKMDIEGAEAAALEGMKRFLRFTPQLTMITEFFPGALKAAGTEPESYLEKLSALGFRIQLFMGEKLVPLECANMPSLYRRVGEEYGVNLLCTRTPA